MWLGKEVIKMERIDLINLDIAGQCNRVIESQDMVTEEVRVDDPIPYMVEARKGILVAEMETLLQSLHRPGALDELYRLQLQSQSSDKSRG